MYLGDVKSWNINKQCVTCSYRDKLWQDGVWVKCAAKEGEGLPEGDDLYKGTYCYVPAGVGRLWSEVGVAPGLGVMSAI